MSARSGLLIQTRRNPERADGERGTPSLDDAPCRLPGRESAARGNDIVRIQDPARAFLRVFAGPHAPASLSISSFSF